MFLAHILNLIFVDQVFFVEVVNLSVTVITKNRILLQKFVIVTLFTDVMRTGQFMRNGEHVLVLVGASCTIVFELLHRILIFDC